jgi:cardiolipin synthase (CMP-forming)
MRRGSSVEARAHGGTRAGDEIGAWRTLPNLLTLARIALVAPFAWLCIRGFDMTALAVFFIAGLTDTLDGTLARRFGQRSQFGRLADPLADKLLTTVAFLVLALFRAGLRAIPLWLAIAVIGRDVLILTGSLIVYLKTRSTAFRPNIFGKANTFIELGVIVVVLASSRLLDLARFLTAVYLLLLASLVVSTADYVFEGLRMLRQPRSN